MQYGPQSLAAGGPVGSGRRCSGSAGQRVQPGRPTHQVRYRRRRSSNPQVFRREIIQSIPIEENRFGFEPEITVKIAKRRLRIYEVGIGYWGRTYEEGKKIGWKDGVRCLWCLLKYSMKERPVPLAQSVASEHPALVSRRDGSDPCVGD